MDKVIGTAATEFMNKRANHNCATEAAETARILRAVGGRSMCRSPHLHRLPKGEADAKRPVRGTRNSANET